MPVSPQDFELYSRMTGAPMPSDAMSRMQMAPEVYQFTRNFAKNPNILEKTGNLLKNIGRGAVMTLGAPLVAASEAEQARMSEQLRNQTAKVDSEEAIVPNPTEENVKSQPVSPAIAKIEKEMELEHLKQANKLELLAKKKEAKEAAQQTTTEKADDLVERVKSRINDPQEPTTADAYGQPVVQNQTKEGVIDKKIEQGSDMAYENDTVAEVLSESQDSQPVEFVDPKQVQAQMESDMIGSSATSKRVSSFLDKVSGSGQQKIDPILLAAIEQRNQEEKFSDHPDIVGGEDDSNVPGQQNMEVRGMNTGATSDLSSHHKEMRKMDALERMAEQSPSTKQIALNEMNKSREGFMAQDGPNKDAFDAKQRIAQRAKDQMLEQMKKNDEDEERIKKLNLNQDKPTTTTPEQKENFKKLVAAQELQKVFPESQDRSLLDPLGVLNDPKFMSAVRQGQNKARLESNLISDRVDDFTAKFVEGARSDIVRGARGNKSLGITRIPATNGDAQVGFVLANKPLDQSPTTATTYGFGVAPGAESLLDNQLTKDTFSSYMQRGMSEAKKGIKRKAGEIFEYLPKNRRVVGGTARLGDITM